MSAWRLEHPRKRVTVKRAFAEGNHVILHCLQEWPGEKNFATIDIFRLNNDGKIVEHWDVMQPCRNRATIRTGCSRRRSSDAATHTRNQRVVLANAAPHLI